LVHLDRLNYHEAWIGEHHSGGFEIIACPELFIAAAAGLRATSASAPASSRCHTTTVHRRRAPDAARLYDARRAMFGVGPGSLVYDAVKMGLKPTTSGASSTSRSTSSWT
jgi:limonene 1,2-monooxygenase